MGARQELGPVSRLIDIAELAAKHAGGPGHDQKSHGNWARGYGAKVRDSSPGWKSAFDAQNVCTIEKNALKHGMTVEEYKAAIEAEMTAFTGSAEVCIRCKPEVIEGIISDGRYRTQFETATSGGLRDPATRAFVEKEIFGYPKNLDPEERPVYGYLDRGIEGVECYYGTTTIHLNDSVRSRTTYCYGDTLDNTNAAKSASLAPTPLATPSYRAGCYWASGGRELDPLGIRSQADFTKHGVYYAEVQIHGGVGLADIGRVSFARGRLPSQKVIQQLVDLGIPVDVRP